MYKFYDSNNILVMQTTSPIWVNWDPKVKSFKVCKYVEREGVYIQNEEGSYNASVEGHIIHPELPVVRMVIE